MSHTCKSQQSHHDIEQNEYSLLILQCLPRLSNLRSPLRRMGCAQFIAGDELLSFAFARLLLETINSSKNASAQKKTVCLFCLFFFFLPRLFFSLAYPKLHLSQKTTIHQKHLSGKKMAKVAPCKNFCINLLKCIFSLAVYFCNLFESSNRPLCKSQKIYFVRTFDAKGSNINYYLRYTLLQKYTQFCLFMM